MGVNGIAATTAAPRTSGRRQEADTRRVAVDVVTSVGAGGDYQVTFSERSSEKINEGFLRGVAQS